ncbi:HIG1 domain family member 2A, mitochondrial-like [Dromiciops gliroides]|uniref:HIG1 domain family member 2A, mitochondrial-like n=1 Tax=Dromiciops gliroides TaxID=33562 RepID=UPI001CC4468B|nr:HIG1 domain family member 2A, mitochondrial-like [Dromiciops gliroides]
MSSAGLVASEVAFDPAQPPVIEGFTPSMHRLQDETVRAKFIHKVRKNPVVPISCLATAGALSYGLYCFHWGNSQTVMTILWGLAVSAMQSPRLH